MTRPRKSPAMPLYGKDAWSDEEFAALPWDAQGLFWRLAFWQWLEGSIPADVARIAEIVGKPRTTKRLLADFILKGKLFIPHPDQPGRLYNRTTQQHFIKLEAERERKQVGADLTNSKRLNHRTGERSADGIPVAQRTDEERLASGIPHATRDSKCNTNGSLPKPGGGAGEGSAITPQQEAVKRVIDALEAHTTGFLLPTGGLVARWVRDFGADAIVAAVQEEGMRGNLDGRDPSYLYKCLQSFTRRPRAVTTGAGASRRGADGLAVTEQPVMPDDIRDLGYEISADEWTREDCTKAEAIAYVAYIRSTYFDRLSEAPTLAAYVTAMRGESTMKDQVSA